MGFSFGSFDAICETAALVICPLVGVNNAGIDTKCYSRNVQLGKQVIFQPATCVVHIGALGMTAIMIWHIRSKYTAVGRKETVMFFYLYAACSLLAIFLDSEIVPTASNVYPWFTAVYVGCVAATYCCLLINGFVGFQFAEDGTPLSLWGLRAACLAMWGLAFFIAVATFKGIAGFSGEKPIGLWVIYFIWPVICVLIYVFLQLLLVLRTLTDRWPLGDIIFGLAFFTVAQVVLFVFGMDICDAVQHYIDGLFFYTLCMLLSVMMVYKYWDSITNEDLEFSVGSKTGLWEIKDDSSPMYAGMGGVTAPAGSGHGGGYFGGDEDTKSQYGQAPASFVGGVSGQGAYNTSGEYTVGGLRGQRQG